jgi:raffinose/stachyose/melibiose transport system substrate-binding protein
MKKQLASLFLSLLAVSLVTGCSKQADPAATASSVTSTAKPADAGKTVKIEFFQNKTEAKASFDKLIQKFKAANPTIDVVQSNPPDAETILKTRISKKDVPDVMGLGANDTYSTLAKAGVFVDFANDPKLTTVQPAYLEMLHGLTGLQEVNGIPYSANANGVLYNKALFKELGLTIPKTWDEFVATAQKVKDAGKIPFYLTLKDAWTGLVPFNALASNLQGNTFIADRIAGKVTFQQGYKEIADKQLKLLDFGHKDNAGKGYADGNTAFAKGQSVMYLQGVWAIPEIKKANPNIDLGTFVFPASNDLSKNKLVSGVDTLLTISKTSKNQDAANKFIEFLLQPENVKSYIDDQKAFPAVQGVTQEDPTVADLNEAFKNGTLIDFADHSFPGAMKLDAIVQAFLLKKDVNAYLNNLDKEWDKVQNRK